MAVNHIPEVLDTSENATGGIAVVTLPGLGPERKPVRRGNFFDNSIERGAVLERFIGWFDLWGIPVQRLRGKDSAFERSFFTFEWPSEAISNAHGPQMVRVIAKDAARLKEMLEQRRPRLIVFLSCYLWQALNTEECKTLLFDVLGAPRDTGKRITGERLGAYLQNWDRCITVALPQPSKNTTETIVRSLSGGMQEAFSLTKILPESSQDPFVNQASDFLIIDAAQSIRQIASHLHVDETRARALFTALENRSYFKDKNGRLRVRFKK